eukprot:216716_1
MFASSEFDAYITQLSQPNRDIPVPIWLAARHLLRALDTNVIVSCFDEIISTYQDKKRIVTNLVTVGTEKEITNIVNILKTAQLKMEQNKLCILSKSESNDNRSYFDYLSAESVFNICEFLTEYDLRSFRMTCSVIALTVFDLMDSHKMRVLNMNELIEQNQYRYPIVFKVNNLLKINHIKGNNKYKTLMNLYNRRYGLETQDNLIL